MLLCMKKKLIAAMVVCVWTTPLLSQTRDTEAQIKAKCDKYLRTPLPAEASLITAPKTWPDCNSYKLYSGIGTNVDYVAARKCAWAERLAIQTDIQPKSANVASVLGGSAMLSMIYANGEGVERNLPQAKRFVCEAGGSLGDHEALLSELDSMSEGSVSQKSKFSFCGQTGSGYMQGWCAAYDKEIADRTRTDALHALSKGWPESQLTLLNALVQIEEEYSHAHAKGEINTAGTARAADQIAAEQDLREEFLAALSFFEKGNIPKGSANDFAKADKDLNLLYRKAMADAEARKSEYGAVQPEGIQDAERAWLNYRNAWIAFAKLHYPTTSANSWLTLLTKDRIDVLEDTLCEIGSSDETCDDEVDEQGPSPLP